MMKNLVTQKSKKKISWLLMSMMVLELVTPNLSFALSSGPVQPEISSFEPVSTTDMVDLFTGDFVYNIPLMDVEGYPVNISYHGGVTMDQEASWVGLGWNINPGAINRAVRGLPDEFKGDTIEKEMNLKPEIAKKIGLSGILEPVGVGEPILRASASVGGYLNISNYRGVSVDFTSSVGVNAKFTVFSGGLNVGASIGSQAGAAINYDANVGVGISQAVNKEMTATGSYNFNTSGVYSPRSGMRQSIGRSASLGMQQNGTNNRASMSTGTSVPIGTQNYTAAVTNASYMNTGGGQLKVGGELYWAYLSAKCYGSISKIKYELDGSRKGFGYFNLSDATDNDLLDFSRDKDGMFNTTMQYLPHSTLTYDVYSVNGQGTGGSFRPFRNDIGSVFDPITKSKQEDDELAVEAGIGNQFEIGGEYTTTKSKSESGPWKETDCYRQFKKQKGGYFEDIYFKEAGELTANNEAYLNQYANNEPVAPKTVRDIPAIKTGAGRRVVRANHIYPITGEDNDTALLLDSKQILSYSDTTGFKTYPTVNKESIPRVIKDESQRLRRKENQVTEIVQNQKDGRRYIYGLPVVNHVQKEAVFAVDPNSGDNTLDESKYLINYASGSDDSKGNGKGMDHYYSATVTPTYVTAHLLTGVLSADYIDVTGNGMSDDDLGTYTKFNYSRKSNDYRWRTPIQSGKAHYMPGYKTDKRDDKAAYTIGSREQWMLHSIETKNYVAEFYVSQRQDALGVLDRILQGGLGGSYNQAPYNAALSSGTKDNKSYKLDSIVLYNKHDRFTNAATAQSIKTVIFNYDYSLCKNVPNAPAGSGKLTLKKIQVKYGQSNLNMSAAYSFKYSDNNPDYDEAAKDRWGNYKPNDDAQLNNFEFPFTKQSSETNNYASAWTLTEISLPSGGVIKAEFESDDYAFVQNKEAMEMFKLQGFGNSAIYKPYDQLYFDKDHPNLYFYFKRRKDAENPSLSPTDNYLKGTKLLYYNVATELSPTKFEPVKGYAEVQEVGYCTNNTDYGYVKVASRTLRGSDANANPVTYTALNLGRYSLPHILFPGSDPDATDMGNVVAGLKHALKEMFQMASNPLENMMEASKAKRADYTRSFVRLTSPGLKKKGGGQRVKSIRFFDSWDAMTGGAQAIYGKNYSYTLKRDDGKGIISSGVASYEPMIGGDELPQRAPVAYDAQEGNKFPPNDPVDLYQELPLGESYYPGPLVGYSNVVVTSINKDKGRSSQTEDISGFYTAKDFPIQAAATKIEATYGMDKSIKDISVEQTATQGFSFVFNDMHGKPRNTEHWVIKPADTIRGRELLNMQKYEYLTKEGRLHNMVPVFDYNANEGKLSVAEHKMGIETDLTIDTRMRNEESKTQSFAANVNASWIAWLLIPIPFGYPFSFTNHVSFKSASTSKITQQYGILNKVISSNEGAVTEVRNEVFDINTGNALVTSVNNEFNDREYNVSYPAYWAYKELGPAYQNHDLTGTFENDMLIDSLGVYATRFVNYNPAYSTQYALPSNMPVARIAIDEEMPKFKLGDEMLLLTDQSPIPIKTWTMGYTSDLDHCYLILATREPYKLGGLWTLGTTYANVQYRIIKSGNKNRLGETIQSYTTADRSNVFPYLKDSLTNLVSLNAQTYKYNLNQVYAANLISDSLNPFVTGKVGLYRPEQQILNLKNRSYLGGTTRNAGIFSSPTYWKTEQDKIARYCPDSSICTDCGTPVCENPITRFSITYLGRNSTVIDPTGPFPYQMDSFKVKFVPYPNASCDNPRFDIHALGIPGSTHSFYGNSPDSFVFYFPSTASTGFDMVYNNGCCAASYRLALSGTDVTIQSNDYYYAGTSTPVSVTTTYVHSAAYKPSHGMASSYVPFRVRKKIQLGYVGHYDGTDNENWVKTQQVSKYNWYGQEIENKEEGIGYNTAIYGYNQQLPICVAKNAQHSDVLYESFEDYALLKAKPDKNESYMPLIYSPFEPYFKAATALGPLYQLSNLSPSTFTASISKDDAHTGTYALKVASAINMPLNPSDAGIAQGYTFKMNAPRKYVVSLWLKPTTPVTDARLAYSPNGVSVSMDTTLSTASAALKLYNLTPKSNIIEGWQKFEATFETPDAYKNFKLQLAAGYYYDDIRLFPFESNSKGFVYEPVSRKLMATLDENNYATFYEYDAEGNLVRTKKETEKGILTITESRSTHRKTN